MKRATTLIVILVVCRLLGVSGALAQEQVATCDATLITLLIVAIEHDEYRPPMPLDRYDFGPYSDKPVSSAPEAPTVREQAEARVAQAAETVEDGGFPGIAREIGELADTVGDLAEAGSSLLEAGQAAFEAGRAALEGTEQVGEMTLGALPGEPAVCTELRRDLVNFLFTQMTVTGSE